MSVRDSIITFRILLCALLMDALWRVAPADTEEGRSILRHVLAMNQEIMKTRYDHEA